MECAPPSRLNKLATGVTLEDEGDTDSTYLHRVILRDSKISEALKETLEQVDSATEQTKNVQHCYDTQHQTFEVLKYRALLVYYECENAGLAELRTRITDMDEIAEQGKKTIEKLKNLLQNAHKEYNEV
ncbi:hypothetical protein KM043_018593 [Ampulex compressa]|nr:hypothetical protein KM043_018593 [Ampulex compressa]